jgi:hypothetical protein
MSSTAVSRHLPKPGTLRNRQSTALKRLAGAGLCSRAVVYLVLAYLACDIATRSKPPSQASGSGALAEVAKQPAGPVLLGLVAAGLAAYGCWRLSQALRPPSESHSDTFPWKRIGWAAVGIVYFVLCAQAVSLMAGSGSGSGGGGGGGASSHPKPIVASVLSWPGGPGWVGLAGVVLGGAGVALAIWAIVRDDSKILDLGRMSPRLRLASKVTEIGGNVTRAFLIVLVSVYLVAAAVTDDPQRARSLDSALESLAHGPAGPLVLGIVAAGLVMFSASTLIEARFRKP